MTFNPVEEFEDNPILALAELRFELSSEDEPSMQVDLRMGLVEIPLENSTYALGATMAKLSVELEGFKPKLGSRYGDINTIETRITESSAKHQSTAAALTAMISGNSASGRAEMGTSRAIESAQSIDSGYRHSGVRALPNNQWKVEDGNGKNRPIESTILSNAKLLTLRPLASANRYVVSATLRSEQSDIDISSKSSHRRVRQKNRERLIQIIVTRSLKNRQPSNHSNVLGTICLASSCHKFEVELNE